MFYFNREDKENCTTSEEKKNIETRPPDFNMML